MDPTNPDKLFAAMYEFRRQPWFFESGGRGSGLHVTVDGGKNWKELTEEDGLPAGKLGRIGLAIAPSDPRIVYAYVEAKDNVFLRSEDGGVSWKSTGATRQFGDRPFYYADIRVDPEIPDRIYSLWSLVTVSEDGGKTWNMLIPWSSLHPDHHAMWINPRDGNFIVEGNDGGVGVSSDRGKTWRFVGNLPVAQFYHIAVDMDLPYNVYGGLQDNGSWRGPAYVWENGGIRNHHWQEVDFGDGFDSRPYAKDSMQGYAMSQEGYLVRWNLRTGEQRAIRPSAEPGDTLRFNWNAGLALDPFDSEAIYFGSQYLHKSADRGGTWKRLGGDLTTDNPAWQRQRDSGGLTPDVTGAENYTTIVAIAPSPVDRNVIWVGTDDGRVQVTRDGGATWTSVETKARGVPANTWVPHICASPHEAGTAFVVFDDHRRSNPAPYVYRADDYGNRWTSLATRDVQGYCLAVEQDPVDPELLFLGTEFGLFVSLDAGKGWMRWTHGLPTCSVMDLAIHPREHDLVMGTHGRSVYVLDDIRPLRALSAEVTAKKIHLFEAPPAQQYQEKQTAGSRFPGATEFRGQNRPYGAMLTFWLSDLSLPHPDDKVERERKKQDRAGKAAKGGEAEAEQGEKGESARGEWSGGEMASGGPGGSKDKPAGPKIKVTVRDAGGKKIRSFERPVYRGMNRIVWDLRSDPFKSPSNPEAWWEDERTGPEVLPGEYAVVLRYKEAEASGKILVVGDPRAELDMADRQAAWDSHQRAGKLEETVAEAVKRLEATRKDVEFIAAKVREMQSAKRGAGGEDDEKKNEVLEKGSGGAAGAPKDSLDLFLEEAEKVQKSAKELDKRLRRDRDAKGIGGEIYVLREVQEAEGFLSSTWDRPSPTVLEYLNRAERSLEGFLVEFNRFYAEDLASFRVRVKGTDFPFLKDEKPLGLGQ
jgi:photosystem II stability/assembly factor-like uncharacterized protein